MAKRSRTYSAWQNMKRRCNKPDIQQAMHYQELDINYPVAWESFAGFYADMGTCPDGLQLDRINNNKSYSKENCRWTTATNNLRNRSCVKLNVEKVRLIKGLIRAIKPTVQKQYAYKLIGNLFGVSFSAVGEIARNNAWKEVV